MDEIETLIGFKKGSPDMAIMTKKELEQLKTENETLKKKVEELEKKDWADNCDDIEEIRKNNKWWRNQSDERLKEINMLKETIRQLEDEKKLWETTKDTKDLLEIVAKLSIENEDLQGRFDSYTEECYHLVEVADDYGDTILEQKEKIDTEVKFY